jgi:hypothetical protein
MGQERLWIHRWAKNTILDGADDWNGQTCNPMHFDQAGNNTGIHEFAHVWTGSSPPPGSYQELHFVNQQGYGPAGSECSVISGTTVTVFQFAYDEGGNTVACRNLAILKDTAAHEIGHRLGFKNYTNCNISDYIMQRARMVNGVYVNRSVKINECQQARINIKTQSEQNAEQQTGPTYRNAGPAAWRHAGQRMVERVVRCHLSEHYHLQHNQ